MKDSYEIVYSPEQLGLENTSDEYQNISISLQYNGGKCLLNYTPGVKQSLGFSFKFSDVQGHYIGEKMNRFSQKKFDAIWELVKNTSRYFATLFITEGWSHTEKFTAEMKAFCKLTSAFTPSYTDNRQEPTPEQETPETTNTNQTTMEQKITIIVATTKDSNDMATIANAVQNSINLASKALLNQSNYDKVQVVTMDEEYPELTEKAQALSDNPQIFASWVDQDKVKMIHLPSMMPDTAAAAAEENGFDRRMVTSIKNKDIVLSPSSVAIRVDNTDGTWFEYLIAVTLAQ